LSRLATIFRSSRPHVATSLLRSAACHEVHKLKIGGATAAEGLDLADGYRPALPELQIGLSSLRTLSGEDPRARVAFACSYLQDGAQDVVLDMVSGSSVPIDFSKAADRSGGLLAPVYVTNAISRELGPIDKRALPDQHTGSIDPARLFPSEKAQLLGFPLKSLLSRLKSQPKITVVSSAGRAPEV